MNLIKKIRNLFTDLYTVDHSPDPELPTVIPEVVIEKPTEAELPTVIPEVVVKELTEAEILSAKLKNVILSDFEKYPPHEWDHTNNRLLHKWNHINNKLPHETVDIYTHSCLIYKIQIERYIAGTSYNYAITISIDDTTLPLESMDLYTIRETFMNKLHEFYRQEWEKKRKDVAEIILNESTRIVCKE